VRRQVKVNGQGQLFVAAAAVPASQQPPPSSAQALALGALTGSFNKTHSPA
jgi:hypothetical protein